MTDESRTSTRFVLGEVLARRVAQRINLYEEVGDIVDPDDVREVYEHGSLAGRQEAGDAIKAELAEMGLTR